MRSDRLDLIARSALSLGLSRQVPCAFSDCELEVRLGDLQWNNKMKRGEATVVFTVQPIGWIGDWQENSAPQWMIVLSGRWFVQSMDGTRIEKGPGDARSASARVARKRTAARDIVRAPSGASPAAL